MLQDVRYAFRTLRKTPGFTAVAVVMLACGVGANTAIFTLINTLFLRPIAVHEPSRLVSLFAVDSKNPGDFGTSHPNYEDIRDHNEVFTGVAAAAFTAAALATNDEPEQLPIEMVSANYFSVLGVEPALGRGFRPEEDRTPDAYPVAVLSHPLWVRRFGARTNVLGETINLNGHPFTVSAWPGRTSKARTFSGRRCGRRWPCIVRSISSRNYSIRGGSSG